MHPLGASRVARISRRTLLGSGLAFSASLGALPRPLWAGGGSLLDYLKERDDLPRRSRGLWIKAVKLRFGGVAFDHETSGRPELGAAKSILAAAIFMRVSPKDAAQGAWDGWRSVLNDVPTPIAIHYQVLSFEGRKPRGRPIDLALSFPEFYNEEIAPDLVVWWMTALAEGRLDESLERETRAALAKTRIKMRPLLVDRLRVLARLDHEMGAAQGRRRAESRANRDSLQEELERAFVDVSPRPEVLDADRRPYDRLVLALKAMGQAPTAEDRALAPGSSVPPSISPPLPPVRDPRPTRRPARRQQPEPERAPKPESERRRSPSPRRPSRGTGAARKKRLERYIRPWLGTPYRWGADRVGYGTDCSGFTRALFRQAFEVPLPRVSRDQYRLGVPVRERDLRPGDLVFFDFKDLGRVTHVGVYVGDQEFAHASFSRGVVKDQLRARWCRRAYVGARRVLP